MGASPRLLVLWWMSISTPRDKMPRRCCLRFTKP